MVSRKITFTNHDGDELAARLELPDKSGESRGFVVFAHCFTCTKDYKSVYHISRHLCEEHGYSVFRFDFTGLGESGGDFADTSFFTNVKDLKQACEYLADEYETPKLLIGHSLGGAAVLHTAAEVASVEAVVTLGAPSDLNDLSNKLLSNDELKEELKSDGKIDIKLLGRDFTLGRGFFDALEETEMRSVVENLDKPLLVLHAPHDRIVSIRHGEAIFSWARQPKAFVSLTNADHLLSKEKEAHRAARLISLWADQFIPVRG